MSAARNKFSPEFRDRAVRMVEEHRGDYPSEWAAMSSIAAKVGCTTETLRRWCREEASRRNVNIISLIHSGWIFLIFVLGLSKLRTQ